MPLTINKRVELVFMPGANGATNRSVAEKFNRIHSDREPDRIYPQSKLS